MGTAPNPSDPPAIGLALGGGGSRALCHLGLLEALEEAGVRVEAVAGSSLGGLLAAMYAFEPDADAVRRRAEAYFRESDLFGRMANQPRDPSVAATPSLADRIRKGAFLTRLFLTLLVRPSLLPDNPVREAVDALLPEADIRDAALPLACNALDLAGGTVRTFTTGPVRRAVLAGTAIATILPPVEWEGAIYADAAPVCPVPVEAARQLTRAPVVAVDLRGTLAPQQRLRNGFDVFRRLECASSRLLNEKQTGQAQVVLRPDVHDIFWSDFRDVQTLVARGRSTAEEAMAQILSRTHANTGSLRKP
jgi:NTE family protein